MKSGRRVWKECCVCVTLSSTDADVFALCTSDIERAAGRSKPIPSGPKMCACRNAAYSIPVQTSISLPLGPTIVQACQVAASEAWQMAVWQMRGTLKQSRRSWGMQAQGQQAAVPRR